MRELYIQTLGTHTSCTVQSLHLTDTGAVQMRSHAPYIASVQIIFAYRAIFASASESLLA